MRVFVAGATGVIGRELEPPAVEAAIAVAMPEVVVHQLSAIPARVDPRRFAEGFEAANKLRRDRTRNLVAAAVAAGARRVVAQSIAQAYKPVSDWVKTEEDPLYDGAPPVFRDVFDAVIELEATVLRAHRIEPIVLRYGNFYGRGTRFASDGSDAELVRQQKFPVAGGGAARWSFIDTHDAAEATVRAIEHGEPGIYNIVDDEPAPIAQWLPVNACALALTARSRDVCRRAAWAQASTQSHPSGPRRAAAHDRRRRHQDIRQNRNTSGIHSQKK